MKFLLKHLMCSDAEKSREKQPKKNQFSKKINTSLGYIGVFLFQFLIPSPKALAQNSFCSSPYNMIYSGHFPNRIDAIHVNSGASVPLTTSNIGDETNSLASDHVNNLVYYAENRAIYAWSPITNTHTVITNNIRNFTGNRRIKNLRSGGAAFYNGSLYLGVDEDDHTNGAEVYKVDFVPGSNGLTVQSVTSLNIGSTIPPADWGDMIIDNNGVMLAITPDATWTYNLNNGTYTAISNNLPGDQHQLAKDGQGRLWAVVYIPSKFIVQVQVVGNSLQPVGQTISVDPHDTNDAAECVIGESSIGDRVWNDANGNGVQDTGENGIGNVTVDLYWDINGNGQIDASDDPVLATQTTDNNGNYDFPDLIFGNYIVKVSDTNGVLTNASLTSASNTQNVNLSPGVVDYNDADFGYQLPVASNPDVLLVKRITKINGQTTNPNDNTNLTTLVNDGINDSSDDANNWPDNYLIGAINAGKVKPGDEIEYTVYFLNAGGSNGENLKICDRIASNQDFKLNVYGTGNDFEFQLGTNTLINLTSANDTNDRAQLISAGAAVDTKCNLKGTNDNGTIEINITGTGNTTQSDLTNIPGSTGKGTPNNSYGFFRFTTTVKQ
ncbi:MAG: SdrD B-like domain-containing protein [Cyanobacteria bacterium J06573_2]